MTAKVATLQVSTPPPPQKIEHIHNNYEGTMPYPGIDHMGRCYDFIKMDPFDLSARQGSGGGGMNERAIDIPPALVTEESSDKSVYIPPGTKLDSESRGERSSRAHTWFTSLDLSASFEGSVTSGLSIPGVASFSNSLAYNQLLKTTNTNETMETFVQSYFEDCHVGFLDNFHESLPLNANFVAAIKKLGSQDGCKEIIQKFGTHYAHAITFGGRMYQRIKISTQTYRSMVKSGISISASAEGTYKKVTASGGYSASSSSSSDFESKSGVSAEELKWVGGTPSSDFDEWVKTVRSDPKPVKMALRPLSDLLTKALFKDDAKVSDKRKWLEDAITQHIKANAYTAPDMKALANKRFHITNRWRSDVGERRVDKHLSFGGNRLHLYDKESTYDLVPWLLIPVPDTTDQFYIQNRWKEEENHDKVGKYVSFDGTSVTLCAESDTVNRVPWQFIPVPGRKDEYYIRSRWNAAKGHEYTDYHLSFTGDSAELYHKDNRYDLAAWKLTPV